MTERIRVLIADDHIIVRSGIRLLLEAEPDIEVVGEALNGKEALKLAGSLQPDVVLMDITMPEMDGLEATLRIKKNWPNIHVLGLTIHRSEEYFFEMLKAGASGYVLKAAKTGELIDAVRMVAQGEVFIYPVMVRKLVREFVNRDEDGIDSEDILSPRENEVVSLLASGYSNKEIAEKLVISLSTVHTHRRNLMKKLGLNSRRELVQYAQNRGLLRES